MADWSQAFNLISLLYVGIAALTLARLMRLGPKAFEEPLSAERARLITATAFYLLTPLAVALHELGHVAAIEALGGRVVDYHFMLYWGYVVPDCSFGPTGDFAVALAGNLVSVAIGIAALLAVLYRPRKAAWNLLWARLAEIQLSLTLVLYPLFCLMGFGGDFNLIYSRHTPLLSSAVAVIDLTALAVLWKGRRGSVGRRFQLFASPAWDRIRAAQRQQTSSDPQPELILAAAYLQAGLNDAAARHAERTLAIAPNAGVATLLLGLALEKTEWTRATSLLEVALADPALEGSLAQAGRRALARVKLAAGDQSGAASAALAALSANLHDVEAAELVARSARQGSGEQEARRLLELAATENLVARQELEALERWSRRRGPPPPLPQKR